jgi:replicative DNA helicase Mcm
MEDDDTTTTDAETESETQPTQPAEPAAPSNGPSDDGPVTDDAVVDKFLDLYHEHYQDGISLTAQAFPDERTVTLDWADLHTFEPAMAFDMLDQPDLMVANAEEALRHFDLPEEVPTDEFNVEVKNLPDADTHYPDQLREEHDHRLVAVRGEVAMTTGVEPKLVEAAFECQRCGTLAYVPQHQGFTEPHQCEGCERQGPFNINFDKSEFVDAQSARIEVPPEEVTGQSQDGNYVDVNFEGDLVTQVKAGERVTVNGVSRLEQKSSGNQKSLIFERYLEGSAAEIEESSYESIDVEDHRETIEALAAGEQGDPYELLVDSLAPGIYGEYMRPIKESIVLQLFGGTRATSNSGEVIRGDLHVLMIGDPSLGKSQIMEAAREIAPRSSMASGKSASKVGLTAAVEKENFGDGESWTAKAGALVRANNGLACIDELDKVDEDAVSSLHRALEQQEVSVNKASVDANLPAKTSLLAAANPKYGRFDQYESVGSQIDLGPALLSRFDFIWTLHDDVEEEEDRAVITGQVHDRQENIKREYNKGGVDDAAIDAPVETDVFRAWIALARQEYNPHIEDESLREDLVDDLASLRQVNGEDEDAPVPVTRRVVPQHLRVAEASARLRLSDTVEQEDIERAKRLIGESLRDVGIDPETGEFDADAIEVGQSKSQQDRVKQIYAVLDNRTPEYDGQGMPKDAFLDEMEEKGHSADKVEHRVEKLKQQGEVVELRHNGEDRYYNT